MVQVAGVFGGLACRHALCAILLTLIAKEGLERVPRDVMIGILIVSVLTAVIVYALR